MEIHLNESEEADILDKLIDLTEEESPDSGKKNSFPDQSNISAKKTKKR